MSRAIEFHSAAVDEALAAQSWYYDVDPKLGAEFKHELDRALDRIAAAPERWNRHHHGTRGFLLERFPYLIVYLHEEVRIQIIAVQHAKRRPGY